MLDLKKTKILLLLISAILVISACSSSAQSAAQISTAVAQTVQAQDALTRVAAIPTLSPVPSVAATAANDGAITNTPPPAVVGAPGCTVSARLASENPPDGTLLKPGDTFLKTWSLENTGTCPWDASYKLIYSTGDLMGGLSSYPLPVAVAPGETKDISIYLKAPDTEGNFTGYWLIQTPWNTYFGVGPNSEPFYVKVRVSSSPNLTYGVISVTYQVVRDPATGCPANVGYTVYATITTNGPVNIHYYWNQSDGNESKSMTLSFTEASSQTISREWKVGKGDSSNSRWMQIIVTGPTPQEYDKATWPNNCP